MVWLLVLNSILVLYLDSVGEPYWARWEGSSDFTGLWLLGVGFRSLRELGSKYLRIAYGSEAQRVQVLNI